MADLSPERLAELAAFCEKATPGPWHVDDDDLCTLWGRAGSVVVGATYGDVATDNALSIVAAVNALPDILAELTRLRKLFDDAGQGEHNVLALVDHYQGEALQAGAEVARLRTLLDDDEHELDLLKADIDEHLPEYGLDDGTDDPANERERVEYAGQELKSLRGEVARLRTRNEALERVAEAARTSCVCLVPHPDCSPGDEPMTCADCVPVRDALAALDGVPHD